MGDYTQFLSQKGNSISPEDENYIQELLAFLTANSSQIDYNNATAKRYIGQLWERIAGENGLAVQELKHRYPKETFAEKSRSAWDIYR